MAWTDLGEQELADLLEVSRIEVRLDQGATMTTIGRHPDLGAFTVVQTMERLGRETLLVTGADEDLMIRVLDDWGRISAADGARIEAEAQAARQLDRLAPGGQG